MESSFQEIQDLFSMFHDFDIIAIRHESSILTLTLEIPWGQIWNEEESYMITLSLNGCKSISCDYLELKSRIPIQTTEGLRFDSMEKSTSDVKVIESLGLSIQSYEYKNSNQYVFYCNGKGKIDSGQLMFTADNYKILDHFNKAITLDKLKQLSTMWWNSIQKMWDEQK
jgi:hypothetical protein